jgi:SDR family mycofactocin-dependent oxidoreductase
VGRFDGKIVLITGAARGQGRSHALAFAREGADLAICDLGSQIASVPYAHGDPAMLEETAERARELGAKVLSELVDVRDYAALAAFVERAGTRLGQVDVAIANAGIASFGPFDELSNAEFSDIFDVNVKGVWNTFKAVVPGMRKRRYGRLIATGSANSIKSYPNVAHYSAAKHAVHGLVKSIALEVGEFGITANTVCPGNVNTGMINNEAIAETVGAEPGSEESLRQAFASLNVLPGGWMEPEEISKAMLYLASDDAGRVTGIAFPVDMGMSIR